jgi:hypothetical protein
MNAMYPSDCPSTGAELTSTFQSATGPRAGGGCPPSGNRAAGAAEGQGGEGDGGDGLS